MSQKTLKEFLLSASYGMMVFGGLCLGSSPWWAPLPVVGVLLNKFAVRMQI
jgi:hypothetical protein